MYLYMKGGKLHITKSKEALRKALSHKYIRRIPTGNPKRPWNYIYKEGGQSPLEHSGKEAQGTAGVKGATGFDAMGRGELYSYLKGNVAQSLDPSVDDLSTFALRGVCKAHSIVKKLLPNLPKLDTIDVNCTNPKWAACFRVRGKDILSIPSRSTQESLEGGGKANDMARLEGKLPCTTMRDSGHSA